MKSNTYTDNLPMCNPLDFLDKSVITLYVLEGPKYSKIWLSITL